MNCPQNTTTPHKMKYNKWTRLVLNSRDMKLIQPSHNFITKATTIYPSVSNKIIYLSFPTKLSVYLCVPTKLSIYSLISHKTIYLFILHKIIYPSVSYKICLSSICFPQNYLSIHLSYIKKFSIHPFLPVSPSIY